jgi:hypothetical protein
MWVMARICYRSFKSGRPGQLRRIREKHDHPYPAIPVFCRTQQYEDIRPYKFQSS